MADLAEAQNRMIARISRSQKPMAIVGLVIAVLGVAYLGWAVTRFNPHVDPRVNPGFDWPVTRLAHIFDRGHASLDRTEETSTPGERRLVHRVKRNMEFSAGVMVFLLRTFLGTLTLVLGLAIVTIVVERARLITMLRRLQE